MPKWLIAFGLEEIAKIIFQALGLYERGIEAAEKSGQEKVDAIGREQDEAARHPLGSDAVLGRLSRGSG